MHCISVNFTICQFNIDLCRTQPLSISNCRWDWVTNIIPQYCTNNTTCMSHFRLIDKSTFCPKLLIFNTLHTKINYSEKMNHGNRSSVNLNLDTWENRTLFAYSQTCSRVDTMINEEEIKLCRNIICFCMRDCL